jgi:DNA-binding GntR family transcriptional regulator
VSEENRFVHENLNRRVANFLREEILWSGRFRTGQHIQEADVAEQLDISRAPVREALRELEHQGLVIYLPRRGAFVASFDHDDFLEIVDIRFMIESRVFEKLIADRLLSFEDFGRLRFIVDDMVSISRNDTPVEKKAIVFSERDIAFHRYLWERSGMKWSLKILTDMYYQLRLAMMHDMILEKNITVSAEMHYGIIDCLEREDLEGAKSELMHHIFSLWRESSPDIEVRTIIEQKGSETLPEGKINEKE